MSRCNYGANLGTGNSAAWNIYRNQNAVYRGPLGFQQSGGINSMTDGTSNTVLLWELRAGPAASDVRGTWAVPRFGANCVSGCDNWGDCYGVNEGNHDNGDDVEGCTNAPKIGMGGWPNGDGQGGPKSLHPGGVHALLGDASTRFVNQTISFGNNGDVNNIGPGRAISTASGGEPVGDF
jgi:hypothetical protein